MSRIGKLPITIPESVQIDIDGSEVTVKGPKGEMKRQFSPDISITKEDGKLLV